MPPVARAGGGGGAEAAVFVFNLGDEDGASVAELEGGGLLGEAGDPTLGGDHEGGIVGAEGGSGAGRTCFIPPFAMRLRRMGHPSICVFEEPGGEASEVPLGAGVGAGAEDDV